MTKIWTLWERILSAKAIEKKEPLIIFTSWFECSIHNELQSLQLGNSRLQLKATLSAIRLSAMNQIHFSITICIRVQRNPSFTIKFLTHFRDRTFFLPASKPNGYLYGSTVTRRTQRETNCCIHL